MVEGLGIAATVDDIEENHLNLNFITGDPAHLSLNNSWCGCGRYQLKFYFRRRFECRRVGHMEDPEDTTWVNWVVSRTEDAEDPVIAQLEEYKDRRS